jgi:hypothetical protein
MIGEKPGRDRRAKSQRAQIGILMKPNSLILAAAMASLIASATAEPAIWKRFEIPETNFGVDLPADIFTKDGGKPESGYGIKLLTADGRANITVQSVSNNTDDKPSSFLAKKQPPRDIVYRRMASNFFVVSSVRKGMIWYDRCNFARGFITCVLINYPAVEKTRWDAVVSRISHSLSKG